MKIDVIGCGSAYSKLSNTSAVLVSDQLDNQLLIDCGPTVPRALWQRETDINSIKAIYFTHIHPDHCAGLAALMNQWKCFGRTQPLDIFCQPDQKAPLESLVRLAVWPQESICFAIRWLDITEQFVWNEWQIRTADTQHEVTNRAIRIDVDGHSFFYSGDGRPTEATRALMKGADLAFQECAVFDPLPEDSSHGDFFACKQLLSDIGVRALGLYHCFDEVIGQLKEAADGTPGLFLSRDGLAVDLADVDGMLTLANAES